MPLALFNSDKIQEALDYAHNLGQEEKEIAQTWLVSEAILAGLYYVLVAAIVFFLGRRIIQAIIAAYREAKAESV
jgi:hypothetical protein